MVKEKDEGKMIRRRGELKGKREGGVCFLVVGREHGIHGSWISLVTPFFLIF
jgi:hypothetical protein